MHEFRHAIRRLAHTPGFTTAVVLTLALVVGASAATFTLVVRVVLAPLPYPDATRLVVLDHTAPGIGIASQFGMSRGIAREYAAIDGVEALALYQPGIEAHLFGVAWYDPPTYVAVTTMLIALGVLSSWIPAYRAASASPVRLLR